MKLMNILNELKKSKYPITKKSFWIKDAKFDSTCPSCRRKIYAGQRIYYFPYAKTKVLCDKCGPVWADKVDENIRLLN